MPGTCIIGLQWGDEAKGKLVDLLTEQHDVVVRYQGGANAGHTVVTGGQTYKLSLIPSGILRPGVQCVVTGGVVLHVDTLLSEIESLRERGVEVGRNLMLSDRMHLIFPWHLEEERLEASEISDGEAIGTTMRGIGPCYRDKVGRSHAIRLGDLYQPGLRERIENVAAAKNRLLSAMAAGRSFQPISAAAVYEATREQADRLAPHVADTTDYLLESLEQGRAVMFEGAQGALLDIDHGTFPYVTSSNSSGTGVASGAGVPARFINRMIGVVKAYGTRVGGGPFPTELDNPTGQYLRERGNEYGTVTRRPRRCGWFDAVAARYTARLSGADALAVMLLDVLSGLPEVRICTAYEIDGERLTRFPSHVNDLRRAEPVYESLPGWDDDISGVRSVADLPLAARRYVERIAELVARPVEVISVGPDREQTIFVDPHPLAASAAST